jgi:CRP-like cAMP-binding protein
MGEGAVLKGEPRPYDVVAIRDSVVAFLPRTTFLWLLAESHPFALWLIHQLNTRLGYYVALVQSVRLNDTTAQVAYCLAELFNQALYPTLRRQVAISQEEIGRLSGVSRQIANRALKELDGRGIIRMGYGTIEVLDLPALQKLAHGA